MQKSKHNTDLITNTINISALVIKTVLFTFLHHNKFTTCAYTLYHNILVKLTSQFLQ